MDGGDGCTAMRMCLMPLNCALKKPVSSLRGSLKMVHYLLDPENLQNHTNQEVQVLVFTLRMLVKLSRPWST